MRGACKADLTHGFAWRIKKTKCENYDGCSHSWELCKTLCDDEFLFCVLSLGGEMKENGVDVKLVFWGGRHFELPIPIGAPTDNISSPKKRKQMAM